MVPLMYIFVYRYDIVNLMEGIVLKLYFYSFKNSLQCQNTNSFTSAFISTTNLLTISRDKCYYKCCINVFDFSETKWKINMAIRESLCTEYTCASLRLNLKRECHCFILTKYYVCRCLIVETYMYINYFISPKHWTKIIFSQTELVILLKKNDKCNSINDFYLNI